MGLALRRSVQRRRRQRVPRETSSRDVDYTITPPYTLTYHIRPEARWSDGVPITARDFVFTLRARSARSGRDPRGGRADLREDPRVTAVDAKTVRVVLRSRFASWRGLFPHILPSHALRGEDFSKVWLSGIDNPKTGRPIGSGPFLVESWARGRAVTFVRNPRYWKSHPAYLDRLVLRFCDPCAALADEQVEWMRAGEVDVLHSPVLSGAQVQELRALPGVRRSSVGVRTGSTSTFGWSEGGAFLAEEQAGSAGARLRHRPRRSRAGAPRADQPSLPAERQRVFLTYSAHYQPNWRRYRRNQAEARRLLEREGCRRGTDGIYACDGRRLSLRLVTLAANARREQTLKLIQGQLRQVGIEIVPVYAPPQRPVQPDPAERGLRPRPLLVDHISGQPRCDRWACTGANGSRTTPATASGSLPRDLDQAQRILDPARQAEVLNRADAQLAKDVPVIPLFENPQSSHTGRRSGTFAAPRRWIRSWAWRTGGSTR